MGRNPNIDYDEEHRLRSKLKVSKHKSERERCGESSIIMELKAKQLNLQQETEEEKVQIAQRLLGLCTSVLKVREK